MIHLKKDDHFFPESDESVSKKVMMNEFSNKE